MFPDPKSRHGHWDTARQTKILVRETKTRLAFEMRTSDWRQIQVELDREFMRTGMADLFDPEVDDYEDDIHDLQAVHSTRMAITHYDKTRGRVDTAKSAQYCRLSGKFHKFYYLLSCPLRSGFLASSTRTTVTVPSQTEVQAALDKLHGDGAQFRSPEQKRALESILRGHSPVVAILPTAGGKTDLILIPALLFPEKTFVVLTPYIALADDLKDRCTRSGLKCHRWTEPVRGRANIVVIVMDTSVQAACLHFLRNIHLDGFFGALYIDEMHTIGEDGHYRPVLPEVIQRLSLPVQHIGLTATFPPSCKDGYEDAMCWKNLNPVYIRANTRKTRMKYSVITVKNGTVREEAIKFIRQNLGELEKKGQKMMVFCPSKRDCDELSQALNCPKYYSGCQDKENELRRFKEGTVKVIVCTGALGAGMDFDDVGLVVHVDKPYGCLSFVQESGRAGRKGEDVESVMFVDYSLMTRLRQSAAVTSADQAMSEFILEIICRRIPLNRYLDGDTSGLTCKELDCRLCDLCEARSLPTMPASANTLNPSQKRHLEMEEGTVVSREKYRKHTEAGLQKEMESEALKTYMLTVVDKFQAPDACVFCYFFYNYSESFKHSPERCPSRARWTSKRGNDDWMFNYDKNSACYTCSLPCDWCEGYLGGKCSRVVDVVKEVCGLARMLKEKPVDRLAQKSFLRERDYIEWLRQCQTVNGKKSTNAFAVFKEVCKQRKMRI